MKISTCSHRPILVPCNLERFEYQADPYVGCAHYCHYCYALEDSETDWHKEIQIHEDITHQLREELTDIPPQEIYMGYITDPYQPCEAEYRQTRKALELYLEKGFSVSILTKSNLVLRDIDILQQLNSASVSVSMAFTDNQVRQQFEANTKETEARIDALKQLREAGIKTNALLCPVIPHLTEAEILLDMLAPIANTIWIYGLSIKERASTNWRNVETILENHHPDLKERIESIIFSPGDPYWTQLRNKLSALQRGRQLDLRIHI